MTGNGTGPKRVREVTRIERILSPLENLFNTQATGGVVLLLAAIAAFAWANSPWSTSYAALWGTEIEISFNGQYGISKTLVHWVNDGLMTLFFVVVGLEIKREMLVGEISSAARAAIPVTAALGGAIAPAAIFLTLNYGEPTASGWGIPLATDIAFVLGILALLQSRIPTTLKVLVTAAAIVDDILAILIIAFFYTQQLRLSYLVLAAIVMGLLIVANFFGINRPIVYAVLGLALWLMLSKSGIHATLAGVLLAITTPARARVMSKAFVERGLDRIRELGQPHDLGTSILIDEERREALRDLDDIAARAQSPMIRMEEALDPWVAYLIVPLFALANAGVQVESGAGDILASSLSVGIILGLVAGKQIGIMLATFVVTRLGIADLPGDVTWRHLYGMAWLGGIGFTVSLFITDLAFDSTENLTMAKLGILIASVIAAIGGYIVLRTAPETETDYG